MTDETLPAVTAYNAFGWVCLDCGRKNYEDGITVEQPHDEAEMREAIGVPPDEAGEWVHMPATVECGGCSHKFRVAHEEI
jgi:hypothetical protein